MRSNQNGNLKLLKRHWKKNCYLDHEQFQHQILENAENLYWHELDNVLRAKDPTLSELNQSYQITDEFKDTLKIKMKKRCSKLVHFSEILLKQLKMVLGS